MKKNHTLLKGGVLALGGYLAYKKLWPRKFDFENKVVVITGGSKGLGMIMARDFGRLKAKIAIVARREDELQHAKEWLHAEGVSEVAVFSCDVAREEAVREMIERVVARYGSIDVLVNNAGIISVGPMSANGVEDFKQAHDVMFWGQLYPTLAVLPLFQQKRSGHIVNITSIGAMVSLPHLVPYSSAKFAALGLSRGLHAELHRYGIKVSTIVPGLMRTASHVNAQFKGAGEYTWFSTLASMPGLSIDAERASREIVDATVRGQAFKIVGVAAKVGATIYTLFPNFSSGALTLVNRILPAPEKSSTHAMSGRVLLATQSRQLSRSAAQDIARYQMPDRENHPENASVPQF